MLCDAQIQNDGRPIILSSIVKIFNNTTVLLVILNIDSINTKTYRCSARIEVNDEYYMLIDMFYQYASSPIFISIDE